VNFRPKCKHSFLTEKLKFQEPKQMSDKRLFGSQNKKRAFCQGLVAKYPLLGRK